MAERVETVVIGAGQVAVAGAASAGSAVAGAPSTPVVTILRRPPAYPQSVSTHSLPGAELVDKGLEDLARGLESVEALLVSIGAPRLESLGFHVPRPFADPEHRLYARLASEDAASAHSRYNALTRRLVSFERAAACAS